MSVEIRYHVIRNGKEVAMYTTKKEADEHDKMLDIAERLAEFIAAAESFDVEETLLEELTLYLARNRMAAIQVLRGTKPKPAMPEAQAARRTPAPQRQKKGAGRKR
ncbi:MAG: YebG family protein [Desulfosarcinaceae bacterium]|nr:YebG family protein [Desulfosarcinaceae bacterium]